MTAMKYALGYNNEGILGVAGLLGSGKPREDLNELLVLPYSYYGGTTKAFVHKTSEEIGIAHELEATIPFGDAFYGDSGNGYISWTYMSSYAASGEPLIYYYDGTEINGVGTIPSSVGDINLVGGNYNFYVQSMAYSKYDKRFYFVISGATINSRLFSTSDFLSWEEHGSLPTYYFGSDNSLFKVNDDGSAVLFDTGYGTYWYSADKVSWTGRYVGNPFTSGTSSTKAFIVAADDGEELVAFGYSTDFWSSGFYFAKSSPSDTPFGDPNWSPGYQTQYLSKPYGSELNFMFVDDSSLEVFAIFRDYSNQTVLTRYNLATNINDSIYISGLNGNNTYLRRKSVIIKDGKLSMIPATASNYDYKISEVVLDTMQLAEVFVTRQAPGSNLNGYRILAG